MSDQDKQTQNAANTKGVAGEQTAGAADNTATADPGKKRPDSGKPRRARSHRPPGRRRLLLTVTLVIAVLGAGCGGLAWLYFQSLDRLAGLDQGLQQLSARLGSVDGRAQALARKQAQDATRLDQLLAAAQQQLGKDQQDLQAVREALTLLQEQRGTGITWKLAEVEYLLEVANHRLQLLQDPATALAALQAARDRLQRLANPGLQEIRAQLAREIRALESLHSVDITALVLELSAMESSVDTLPLSAESQFVYAPGISSESAPPAAEDPTWKTLASRAWQDISKLIKPRRVDEPVQPLLPPDQAYFLLQNLRLKLGALRLAALRGDDDSFHRLSAEVREWVTEFFDTQQPAVAALISALDKYKDVKLSQAMPDISGSLMSLRAWRARRDGGG